MKTTRIYFAGAGVIAQHHAEAMRLLPQGSTLKVRVADPNPIALENFKTKVPEALSFPTVTSMLESEDPMEGDIVIVCAPPFAHDELVRTALNSERHVLCEKPLAMTRGQADEMTALAKHKSLLLGCCSTRFLGVKTTDAVKNAFENGAIGEPYQVRFVHRNQRGRSGIEYQPESLWFLNSSKSGGGVLMDWGPYDFTVLNYVLSPERVEIVHAWTANPETTLPFDQNVIFDTEQHVGALMIYHISEGRQISVTYERAACTYGEEFSIAEIEGIRGSLKWNWLCFDNSGTYSFTTERNGSPHTEIVTLESQNHFHHRPLLYFFGAVNGEETLAVHNEDAHFNFSCLQAIYECAKTGKTVDVVRGGEQH